MVSGRGLVALCAVLCASLAFGACFQFEADKDGDGRSASDGDCDDDDPEIYAGALERCDGLDNDCSGTVDDAADADGDGATLCLDCADDDPARYPAADEACDGTDNDCDEAVDEGVTTTYYGDYDGDGAGGDDVTVEACMAPDGYLPTSTDCDDDDPSRFPGADELCDGIDNDCDKDVPLDEEDLDGDGYNACHGDCDEGDTTRYPGAAEACNGRDDDCNGAVPAIESDGDADGLSACQGDCDDTDGAVNPSALEVCNAAIDDDCDPQTDEDGDADADSYSLCQSDCADDDEAVNPGATELCNGGVDDDCDPQTDEAGDLDGDGYSLCQDDCVDADPAAFPDASEVCDGIDNDCDDQVDEGFALDADLDGYHSLPCGGDDCDDDDPAVHPDAIDTWYDGTDQDCDGADDYDQDRDSYDDPSAPGGGSDCDDTAASIHPGSEEQCNDLDDDCDDAIDEALPTATYYLDSDGDGYGVTTTTTSSCAPPAGFVALSGDCNDTDPSISPGPDVVEDPTDSIDQNCDGILKCTSLDCNGAPELLLTSSGMDNEGTVVNLFYATCADGEETAGTTTCDSSAALVPDSPSEDPPRDTVIADLDSDGYLDALVGFDAYVRVFWGAERAGGLEDDDFTDLSITGAGTITALSVGDLYGDGTPEIVVSTSDCTPSSFVDGNAYILFTKSPGFRFGSFTTQALHAPCSTGNAIGDLDVDGDPDLVFSVNQDEGADSVADSYIYYQINATFSDTGFYRKPISMLYTTSVAIADMNCDGINDIVFSNGLYPGVAAFTENQSRIYFGVFEECCGVAIDLAHPKLIPSFGDANVIVSDVDGDSYNDILFPARYYVDPKTPGEASQKTTSHIWWGPEHTRNTAFSTNASVGAAVVDLDLDGIQDVVFANESDLTPTYAYYGSHDDEGGLEFPSVPSALLWYKASSVHALPERAVAATYPKGTCVP